MLKEWLYGNLYTCRTLWVLKKKEQRKQSANTTVSVHNIATPISISYIYLDKYNIYWFGYIASDVSNSKSVKFFLIFMKIYKS